MGIRSQGETSGGFTGRAAERSGLSKWDFIEYLGENEVPIVDYDQDEMRREFKTSDILSKRLKK
jgi:hypothetical protein